LQHSLQHQRGCTYFTGKGLLRCCAGNIAGLAAAVAGVGFDWRQPPGQLVTLTGPQAAQNMLHAHFAVEWQRLHRNGNLSAAAPWHYDTNCSATL